jgi:hypothetical protein
MSMHNALTSKDIELLFDAAESTAPVQVVTKAPITEAQLDGRPYPEVGREGVQRLVACGYLEGGPDTFTITRAGKEYAESMR